ncbi:MAG TPA: hypothetical protein VKD72_38345 [Gemmataceae bacterium]|nr:hypothetical protein [Gemmataceae bacterium]
MRVPVELLVGVVGAVLLAVSATPANGREPAARYQVVADLKTYPQGTAREAFAAVLKAIENKRIDYLLAQLADPDWVDGRVKAYADGFEELVKETTAKLDPPAVKRLGRFLKDGEFETVDSTVVVRLKDVNDRVVRLRRADGRWYLQSLNKP